MPHDQVQYGHGPAMPLTDLIKPYLYTCLLLLTQAFKNKYQGSFWYHLSQRSWWISLDPLSPRVVVLVLLMHHSPWLWKRQTQKTTQWLWAQKLSSWVCLVILLMLQKSCEKTTWDVQKPLENNGINGQPQQVGWISEPSTVVTKVQSNKFRPLGRHIDVWYPESLYQIGVTQFYGLNPPPCFPEIAPAVLEGESWRWWQQKWGPLVYIGDYTTQLYGDYNKPL